MITSKYIINFSEEYVKTKKITTGKYGVVLLVVYKNPTSSDIKELVIDEKKNVSNTNNCKVRFIVDGSNHTLYVWNSYYDTHDGVLDLLGLSRDFIKNPQLLRGWANAIIGGYLESPTCQLNLTISDNERELIQFYNRLYNLNWNWTERYIKGLSSLIDRNRNHFEEWKLHKVNW